MVYIVFMLILLLPTIAGFGAIFQKLFGNVFLGLSALLLSGVFFISMLLTTIAFFFPLNIFIETGTLAIGIASFFYLKIHLLFWDFFSKVSRFFFEIALVIVLLASYYPFILDHFGYYVPTIQWITEFGLVQGISNLDLLLGQMSIWHLFEAGFSNFADPFLRINAVVLLIYLIYIFEKKSWIHLLFLPVLFLFSQSPSPDLPVIAIALIVLNEYLNHNKNASLLFAFSVFVFALKPTMIWLPLFGALYSLVILKTNLKFIIPGVLVLLVFFIKNIWTFGFPVFPVQLIDLGFSWKPNPNLLKNSSEMAIMKTYDMQFTIAQIKQFTTFDYVKNWFFLSGIKKIIHLLLILSLVVFFFFSVKVKSKIIWLLFISILIKTILILSFSAQYRFFLEIFFVIFFVIFYQSFPQKRAKQIFAVLSIIVIMVISYPTILQKGLPSFKLGNFMTGFTKNQIYKPAHFEYNHYKTHQIGNLKFNVVENYPFSFDTPLPAISPQFIQEDLNSGIFPQLKGKTLKEGLIWRKINHEEKQKLQSIVKGFNRKNGSIQ